MCKIDFALFALDGCFHIHVLRVDSLSKPTKTFVSMICDNPVQWRCPIGLYQGEICYIYSLYLFPPQDIHNASLLDRKQQ